APPPRGHPAPGRRDPRAAPGARAAALPDQRGGDRAAAALSMARQRARAAQRARADGRPRPSRARDRRERSPASPGGAARADRRRLGDAVAVRLGGHRLLSRDGGDRGPHHRAGPAPLARQQEGGRAAPPRQPDDAAREAQAKARAGESARGAPRRGQSGRRPAGRDRGGRGGARRARVRRRMTGWELAHAVRERGVTNTRGLPICIGLYSALLSGFSREQLSRAQVDFAVTKLTDPDAVLDAVERALAWSEVR